MGREELVRRSTRGLLDQMGSMQRQHESHVDSCGSERWGADMASMACVKSNSLFSRFGYHRRPKTHEMAQSTFLHSEAEKLGDIQRHGVLVLGILVRSCG